MHEISMEIYFVLDFIISVCTEIYILRAQGHLARKSFAKKIFKLDSWLPGGFLSYWNHQLIKFEEEKRFGL